MSVEVEATKKKLKPLKVKRAGKAKATPGQKSVRAATEESRKGRVSNRREGNVTAGRKLRMQEKPLVKKKKS